MAGNWFHVEWRTYATWLPGDPRGFRSRDHRIHSSGNIHSPPPPGEHAGLYHHAKSSLRKPPVELNADVRKAALAPILAKANECRIEPECASVSRAHVHLLAVFDLKTLHREVGRIKRHSSHAVRAWIPGTVWGADCDHRLIRHDDHRIDVTKYILHHAVKEDAEVWFRGDAHRTSQEEHGLTHLD